MSCGKLFTRGLVGVLCLALVAGCETAGQSAALGGALGAGAGAIIGHQSGHALEGALIGGAVGAGAGYLAKKAFDRVQARKEAQRLATQEQVNKDWEESHQGEALPETAEPEVVVSECAVAPSDTVTPGQEVAFKLAFQNVGAKPYEGALARADALAFNDPETNAFEVVKDFGESELPADGKQEHSIAFEVPADASPGQYRLHSKVYDKGAPTVAKFEHDFNFQVAQKVAMR